ncbi:MGMT family protein [Pannus brasiliensis CCIBt3594]|uniref:MGMT family protein n=1 Tax=Pannus brasiliensis CCIBt3594 TaxID=1427578 RepID=A0AAW9QR43_9CHRO
MSAYEDIYRVTRRIPRGKVATYGQIAYLSGRERQARLVGYALHRVDLAGEEVPWQRVVNARGEISYSPFRRGSDYLQRALLEEEGIVFDGAGKIDLRKYQWQAEEYTREDIRSCF